MGSSGSNLPTVLMGCQVTHIKAPGNMGKILLVTSLQREETRLLNMEVRCFYTHISLPAVTIVATGETAKATDPCFGGALVGTHTKPQAITNKAAPISR